MSLDLMILTSLASLGVNFVVILGVCALFEGAPAAPVEAETEIDDWQERFDAWQRERGAR